MSAQEKLIENRIGHHESRLDNIEAKLDKMIALLEESKKNSSVVDCFDKFDDKFLGNEKFNEDYQDDEDSLSPYDDFDDNADND